MIKLNEKYSISRDKYQWILHESRPGVDKDGNPKFHVKQTFHGSLKQAFSWLLDIEAGDRKTLQEILDKFDSVSTELSEKL